MPKEERVFRLALSNLCTVSEISEDHTVSKQNQTRIKALGSDQYKLMIA